MKIRYVCECCNEPIDEIDMEYVNEEKLGITALTEEEKRDIIKTDGKGQMVIMSMCDDCINALGLPLEEDEDFILHPQVH